MNKLLITVAAIALTACGGPTKDDSKTAETKVPESQTEMTKSKAYVKDTHSYAEPEKVAVSHISLDLDVDFDKQIIAGTASHTLLHNALCDMVVFDMAGLEVTAVRTDDGAPAKFEVVKGNSDGDALHVMIDADTKIVHIDYSTSPGATAVMWLDPQQTTGKELPFLFTQGQAILTRSWIPCQDSPGVRVTYDAKMKVPKELMAVMSASNPTTKSADGQYSFEMKQAIPPYLIALAIGDLEFKSVGKQTGVYAEPQVIDKAAYELEDMQAMVEAAEGLYGAYRWDQYDVIFLPPSFPFGGMENPRLTFATPTILAGDKSLTSLIAHELAHSWSGNLVTNATWDDFWLNEGFTVYFEYRIMEEVYGKDYTTMIKSIGAQDLAHTVEQMTSEHKHADTHLKLNLVGRNPDDGMTDIAYEKGHMFLEMLENTYGRQHFDQFLKGYFDKFAFQNMTTERFLDYLDKELLSKHSDITRPDIDEWVYGPGLPANTPVIVSDRFEKVADAMSQFVAAQALPDKQVTDKWSTHEWLHFLRNIPNDADSKLMAELDKAYGFNASQNAEILGIWFVKVANTRYAPGYAPMQDFLVRVGRRKFLTPIYSALKENGNLDLARKIYKEARPNYHSVSTGTMDQLLN